MSHPFFVGVRDSTVDRNRNIALLPSRLQNMQFACRVTVFLLRGLRCDGAGLADQELITDFGLSALQELCRSRKN
jgi:hypothetical protein